MWFSLMILFTAAEVGHCWWQKVFGGRLTHLIFSTPSRGPHDTCVEALRTLDGPQPCPGTLLQRTPGPSAENPPRYSSAHDPRPGCGLLSDADAASIGANESSEDYRTAVLLQEKARLYRCSAKSRVPKVITPNNLFKPTGVAMPPLTGTVATIRAGDNITVAYSTTATASSAPGTYTIFPTVSDPNGRLANYNLTLNSGTLTLADGPAITVQPVTIVRVSGTTATFSVQAIGGTPLSYQWSKGGI